ncbi:innexin-11-like [Littorina saxatilis]|uniref:innexin-11-like n=1 Tax=Littorina saxatilis TaxID=31220 RepID=UPI0038B4FD1E
MDWTRKPDFDLGVFSQFSLFDTYGQDPASLLTANVTFVWMLVVGAFLSAIQLVGEPIECLCPAESSDAMCNYTKSYCWTSPMYVIDYDNPIPTLPEIRYESAKRVLAFYPIVPFILFIVACILKSPNFIWRAFMGNEGLNIPKVVEIGLDPQQDDDEAGAAVAFEMTFNLEKGKLIHKRRIRKMVKNKLESVQKFVAALGFFPLGSGLGAYQTGLFMFTRLLTLVLCLAVFRFVGYTLHTDFHSWGLELIRRFVTGDDDSWEALVFPKETLCDFKIRQLQNVQQFTIQCLLPINMWSEKVFIALWFWLVLLVLANVYSYQYWFRKLIFPSNRRDLVSKHLLRIIATEKRKKRQEDVTNFALNYLTHDCILVLKMLEICVGDQFANTTVKMLWKEFNKPSVEEADKPPVEEMKESLDSLNGEHTVDSDESSARRRAV